MKKLVPCFLAAMLCATACSRRPKEVLSDKEAASLIADLQIAESYGTFNYTPGSGLNLEESDTARKILRQSIMKQHGVTEAQLDTTIGWYGHNLDKYEEMYELVIENIAEKQKKIAKMNGTDEVASPTLWPYADKLLLRGTPDAPYCLPFSISGDQMGKGSQLVLEAKAVNTRMPGADVYLAAVYADGSLKGEHRTMNDPNRLMVTLNLDTTQKIKTILGYINVTQTSPLVLDSISLKITNGLRLY